MEAKCLNEWNCQDEKHLNCQNLNFIKQNYFDCLQEAVGKFGSLQESLAYQHIMTQLPLATYSLLIVFTQFFNDHLTRKEDKICLSTPLAESIYCKAFQWEELETFEARKLL